MPAAPLVTVCIPVYNREAFIAQAIESVLAQDFSDYELLLLDDGSTDGSVEIMRRYRDPRIRLERNDGNRGIPCTRNRALQLARGEYLALLDSDDMMAAGRLASQVRFLQRNPGIATVGGWVKRVAASGATRRLVRPLEPGQLRAWLLFRSSHANTTLMARTQVLREFGYDEQYPVCEDFELLVRLSRRYQMANLPRVLTIMREHPGRTTRSSQPLVEDAKQRLIAAQLERLGIAADAGDLQRHFWLTRMRPSQWQEWSDYQEWARRWLETLLRANDACGEYPRAALAGLVGQVWIATCVQGLRGKGPRALAAGLRQLPWCGRALASVIGNLRFASVARA
jgi:hypothetical protein